MWLVKVQWVVEPQLELQLGLREKLWQVEHHRVICSDVKAQESLLERLLDEAAALYNRTQDPSVDEQAQNALQEAYNNVRTRAEVTLRSSEWQMQVNKSALGNLLNRRLKKIIHNGME